MSNLVRFGVSIEKGLLEEFDHLLEGGYPNRSEAIRDLIREKMVNEREKKEQGEIIGSLTLIYDHHQRGLTEKMLELQHSYHNLFKSSLHLHLDHHHCLEVVVIQGEANRARQVANQLIGLKGVKHGKLTFSAVGDNL